MSWFAPAWPRARPRLCSFVLPPPFLRSAGRVTRERGERRSVCVLSRSCPIPDPGPAAPGAPRPAPQLTSAGTGGFRPRPFPGGGGPRSSHGAARTEPPAPRLGPLGQAEGPVPPIIPRQGGRAARPSGGRRRALPQAAPSAPGLRLFRTPRAGVRPDPRAPRPRGYHFLALGAAAGLARHPARPPPARPGPAASRTRRAAGHAGTRSPRRSAGPASPATANYSPQSATRPPSARMRGAVTGEVVGLPRLT